MGERTTNSDSRLEFFAPNSSEIELEECFGVIAISQELSCTRTGSDPFHPSHFRTTRTPPSAHEKRELVWQSRTAVIVNRTSSRISKPRSNIPQQVLKSQSRFYVFPELSSLAMEMRIMLNILPSNISK